MANFMLLRGLVRDFGYWLQGPKDDAKGRKARIEHYQKKLQDEGAIDGLEEQDVQDLFVDLWALGFLKTREAREAFVSENILKTNGGANGVKKWLKDMVQRGEKGLTEQDFDELLKGIKGVGPAILSELLCLRFPDRYWIWNRVTEGHLKNWGRSGHGNPNLLKAHLDNDTLLGNNFRTKSGRQ